MFGIFGTIGTLIFFWYFRPEVENSTKRRALKVDQVHEVTFEV